MMVNTPNRNYPLVAGGNQLQNDVLKLIALAGMIDADVQSLFNALAGKADLSGPAFTTSPTAPTPASGDDSNKLATTAFVKAAQTIALANFIGAAPAALDTWMEMVAAAEANESGLGALTAVVGNKANSEDVYLKAAMNTLLADKLDKSGGNLTSDANRLAFANASKTISLLAQTLNPAQIAQFKSNTGQSKDWETIRDDDISNQLGWSATSLSAYKHLRLKTTLVGVGSGSSPNIYFSTDNGANFLSSGYYYEYGFFYDNGSYGCNFNGNAGYFPVTSGNNINPTYPSTTTINLTHFNKPQRMGFLSDSYTHTYGGQAMRTFHGGWFENVTSRDALRIASAVPFTGNFLLEGIRG